MRMIKFMLIFSTILIFPNSIVYAQIKKFSPSFASSTTHEVDLSLSRISFESYEYQEKNSDINIYAGYHHYYRDGIQFGGEGGLLALPDGNDTKTIAAAMGIMTYNLQDPIRESFFLQAGLGLYPAYDKDDREFNSAFSMLAGFGMRFEMWGKVNFKPYFRLWKRGDEDSRIEVQVLNFSIFY